jgi:hypothetical protein
LPPKTKKTSSNLKLSADYFIKRMHVGWATRIDLNLAKYEMIMAGHI